MFSDYPWAHHGWAQGEKILKIKCSRTLENAFLKCTYIVVWPKSLPCILPLRQLFLMQKFSQKFFNAWRNMVTTLKIAQIHHVKCYVS